MNRKEKQLNYSKDFDDWNSEPKNKSVINPEQYSIIKPMFEKADNEIKKLKNAIRDSVAIAEEKEEEINFLSGEVKYYKTISAICIVGVFLLVVTYGSFMFLIAKTIQ
jgi:hypothetical protein